MKNPISTIKKLTPIVICLILNGVVFGQGEFIVEFDIANEAIIKTGPKIENLTWIYPNERSFDENNGRFILNSSNSSDDGIRLYSVNTSDGSIEYSPELSSNISTFQYSNSTNTMYALEQDNTNGVKYLVSVNQTTGSATRIGNSIPGSSVYSGNPSAFDESNQVFIFIAPNSGSSPILYSINVSDGSIIADPTIPLATGTTSQNIMHIDYDNSTGTLYGFMQDNGTGKFHLIEINTGTAVINTIGSGTTNASNDCSGTIDEDNGQFVYLYRSNPGEYSVVHLDISTGNQTNKIDISLANTVDNLYGLEYDHNQNKLFGYHWESVTYEEIETEWVPTSSPPNGTVWAMETIGSTLFAGTFSGGVYMSTDQGGSWVQRNGSLTDLEVYTMASYGGDLFIGTGGTNSGVYKSSDLGGSWIDVTPNDYNSSSSVRALVIADNNIFLGSHGDGIYVSPLTNISSATWSEFGSDLPDDQIRSLYADGNIIYAGTYGQGVWKSSTSSASWTITSNTMGTSSDYIQAIDGNGVAMFAGNISGLPVLYHSDDNGVNWISLSTSDFLDKPVYAITHDEEYVYVGTEGAGVLVSNNNGTNWFTFNRGFKDQNDDWYCNQINVRSFVFDNDFIYAGTDCGVWKRSMQTSGINPKVDALTLRAYPNPAKNVLTIEVEEHVSYVISGLLGKVHANGEVSVGTHQIDLTSLAQGIYFIRLNNDHSAASFKFIKQ